jgi:pSer/pThr/pTyr-binding forkhead associated (FHA) protein
MKAKLFCKTGELKGASYVIVDKAVIGKDPACTISLRPTTLSRRHAKIFFNADQGCYEIQDLESRNGTRVDGIPVIGTERLRNLHIITLADKFDFIFQVIDEKSEGLKLPPLKPKSQNVISEKTPMLEQTWALPSTKKKTLAEDKTIAAVAFVPLPKIPQTIEDEKTISVPAFVPIPTILKAMPTKIFLLERQGALALTLKEGENSIGREKGCDILIDHNSLSRRHAIVKVTNGTVTVRDCGSKNNTSVNGNVISDEVTIVSGSAVAFGFVTTILRESV